VKKNLVGFALFVAGAALGVIAGRGVPAVTAQENPHGGAGAHKTPPQHVTVRYMAGDRTDVMGIPAVTGFNVESLGGDKKFLVCTTAGGQRVYFAYDHVIVVDSRALGTPATEGIGKDVPAPGGK
jgi:hypothetical protein